MAAAPNCSLDIFKKLLKRVCEAVGLTHSVCVCVCVCVVWREVSKLGQSLELWNLTTPPTILVK